jgi:hypothetical protein
MAAARPPKHHQQQKAANLARTITKLLRRKRSDSAAAGGQGDGWPASVVELRRLRQLHGRRHHLHRSHHAVADQALAIGEPRCGVLP